MRAWLGIVFACLVSSQAWGETVSIRSADHDGFTRVVFDTAQQEGILIQHDEGLLQVTFSTAVTAIETAGFFDRISRKRVSSLKVDASKKTVSFSIACPCSIREFKSGARLRVVDVRDDPQAVDNAKHATASEWPGFARHSAGLSLPDVPTMSNPFWQRASIIADETDAPVQVSSRQKTGENEVLQDILTNRLFAKLERGGEAGNDLLSDRGDEQESDLSQQIEFRSLDLPQANALIQIETGAAQQFEDCNSLDVIDPLSWPVLKEPLRDIARLRRELGEAVDPSSDQAIRHLAKGYAGLAMGAETRAVLNALSEQSSRDKLLLALSWVLDGEQKASEIDQIGAHNCSETLVWQALAGSYLNARQLQDAKAQFDQWPDPLKGVFAAQFAGILLENDRPDGAELTLRRAQGTPQIHRGDHELSRASILRETQGDHAALQLLRPIVEEDRDNAPEAALVIAEIAQEQDMPMETAERAALEAYRFELKGTEREPELLRAQILAAAQSEDFEESFSLFAEYVDLVRPSKSDLVLDRLGGRIQQIESDAAFLREVVSIPPHYFDRLSMDNQAELRARVTALGFGDLSNQLGILATVGKNTVPVKTGQHDENQLREQGRTISEALKEEASGLLKQEIASERDGTEASQEDQVSETNVPNVLPKAPLAEAIRESDQILEKLAVFKDSLVELGL